MLIPVLFIVLIVFILAGTKVGTTKGGEDVIKNVYIYLVLFATLMMTIGGSVGVFMALADILAPAPYYQSFEEYKRWGAPDNPKGVDQVQLSEEELRSNYEAMIAADRVRAVDRAKNTLIKSIGWIIIPLPVFIYFQRRLNRNGSTA